MANTRFYYVRELQEGDNVESPRNKQFQLPAEQGIGLEDSFVRTGVVGADAEKIETVPFGPAPVCPKCGQYIGMLKWNPPLKVKLHLWTEQYPKLIPAGQDLLVTENFRRAFVARGLHGLSAWDSVQVMDVSPKGYHKNTPPQYYRAYVAHSNTAVDVRASSFEMASPLDELCEHCRMGGLKRWRRVVFESGTWDGLDVFTPRGMGGIFCTCRFMKMCESLGIHNVQFVPIEDYEYDFFPSEGSVA